MEASFIQFVASGLLLASSTGTALAQSQQPAPAAAPTSSPSADAGIDARMATLEQEIAELRAQLTRLTNGAAAPTVEDRIDGVDQAVKVLARKIELEKEQAAEAATTTPVTRAGRDGFAIRSADSSFLMRFRGYVQSDFRTYPNDEQNAADLFELRRVRPIVEGTIFRQFDFRVMPDFGEGKTQLQDAYLDSRFTQWFQVRAGKFKPPVGLERLASATDLPFIERALPTALVPNRDVGVMLHGDSKTGSLTYAVGVFNGVADGASTDGDDQDGKDVAARVFVQPFKSGRNTGLQGLGFGVAGSSGIQRGTTATPNLPSYKSNGQLTIFKYRSDGTDAGTAIADGRHYRATAQGYYYAGRVGVLAEHVLSSQHVRRGTTSLDALNTSWQLQGSFVLTGERASYRGVSPGRSFDRSKGTWGAFEVVTRYNVLSLDHDLFPLFANPANSVSAARAAGVGVNWYLNTGVKISTDYEHTLFGSTTSVRRPAEHDLFTRFQVSF